MSLDIPAWMVCVCWAVAVVGAVSAVLRASTRITIAAGDGINIAIVGRQASGKSMLVNALRRVKSKGPTAAPTGFTQGTTRPAEYLYQRLSAKVNLCDLPGYGSDLFPEKDFIRLVDWRTYNMVVLVVDARWTEYDVSIAKAVRLRSIPCLVVRSAIDAIHEVQNLDSEEARSRELDRIRNLVQEAMNTGWVYMVSSLERHWDDEDLGRLRKDITEPFMCRA